MKRGILESVLAGAICLGSVSAVSSQDEKPLFKSGFEKQPFAAIVLEEGSVVRYNGAIRDISSQITGKPLTYSVESETGAQVIADSMYLTNPIGSLEEVSGPFYPNRVGDREFTFDVGTQGGREVTIYGDIDNHIPDELTFEVLKNGAPRVESYTIPQVECEVGRCPNPFPGASVDLVDPEGDLIRNVVWEKDGMEVAQGSIYTAPSDLGPGIHRYNLKWEDEFGSENSLEGIAGIPSYEISITQAANNPPQVSLSVSPNSGQEPLTVSINSTVTDPDGDLESCILSFGDGSSDISGACSTITPRQYTYANAGNYTLSLRAEDERGNTGLDSEEVTVTLPPNNAPVYVSGLSNLGCEVGETLPIPQANFSDPDGDSIVAMEYIVDGVTKSSSVSYDCDEASVVEYYARAQDERGDWGESPMFFIDVNSPPSYDGGLEDLICETGESITLPQANFSDSDGTVESVSYIVNGSNRGSNRNYTCPSSPGSVEYFATAVDDDGAITNSPDFDITVEGSPNQDPVISGGGDIGGVEGDVLNPWTESGASCSDPDGDSVTRSPMSFTLPPAQNIITPTFGELTLECTDGNGGSDEITIGYTACPEGLEYNDQGNCR